MANGPSAIRAVLFDADGVVQHPAKGWLALLGGLCGDPSRTDEFVQALFEAEQPCLVGEGNFPDVLARILKDWNSATPIKEALELWCMIEPDPEILAIVRGLRLTGIRVGLATNQQAERAKFMSADLGYSAHFDHLFYSFELGFTKPSVEFFTAILDHLDMGGAQVLFIDDHELNVSAARQVGLKAELYDMLSGATGIRRLLICHGLRVA